MYTLHIGNKNYSSWSLRPWILMRELGIAFTEQLHVFATLGNWSRFRSFSPTGRVPVLVDGATSVWDSLAITEYLAERHAGVWPADPLTRAWARSAVAEMHGGFPALRGQCSMNCGVRVRMRELTPALQSELARLDELWCEGLTRFSGPFLAGAVFTAADAFFAPVAFRVQSYALPLSAPSAAWVQRVLALPGMRDWYAAGIAETWREPDHEAEVAAVGSVIQDLRSGAIAGAPDSGKE
jgi:glutathione S-transferase